MIQEQKTKKGTIEWEWPFRSNKTILRTSGNKETFQLFTLDSEILLGSKDSVKN